MSRRDKIRYSLRGKKLSAWKRYVKGISHEPPDISTLPESIQARLHRSATQSRQQRLRTMLFKGRFAYAMQWPEYASAVLTFQRRNTAHCIIHDPFLPAEKKYAEGLETSLSGEEMRYPEKSRAKHLAKIRARRIGQDLSKGSLATFALSDVQVFLLPLLDSVHVRHIQQACTRHATHTSQTPPESPRALKRFEARGERIQETFKGHLRRIFDHPPVMEDFIASLSQQICATLQGQKQRRIG